MFERAGRTGRGAACLALLVLAVTGACGRSGANGGTRSPTPTPIETPLLEDTGDGHDGPLLVDNNRVVSPCYVLQSSLEGSVVLAGAGANSVEPGRRLLLLQVQDDGAESGDQAVLGSGLLPAFAGSWDVVRATAVTATAGAVVVSLDEPVALAFGSGPARAAQACEMPEYSDVDVQSDGSIRAQDWDGSRGGVVSFFASGTLTVDGDVDASGAGFRRGERNEDPATPVFGVTAMDVSDTEGGGKGEGLDRGSLGLFGRGNYWTGAGGGNGNNAGGGGGGGGGRGGHGSPQQGSTGSATDLATRGMPGVPVVSGVERLVFGGGGGAGHANSSTAGRGGRGGGLIVVIAGSLTGNGDFSASGDDGDDSGGSAGNDDSDGGGGGGAGGTIFVRALSTTSFGGSFVSGGGSGGDSDGRGPGGGGGGGRVLLEGFATAPAVQAAGGPPGTDDGADPGLVAEPGAAGTVRVSDSP